MLPLIERHIGPNHWPDTPYRGRNRSAHLDISSWQLLLSLATISQAGSLTGSSLEDSL